MIKKNYKLSTSLTTVFDWSLNPLKTVVQAVRACNFL